MRKEIYKVWAPFDKKWIDWVRPVAFVEIKAKREAHEVLDYTIPDIGYLQACVKDMAIILDDSGVDSIKEGIALAKIGYRPIPVFNGTNPTSGAFSTTNNSIIVPLLVWGANELKNIKLEADAPPVFLLDSNRLNRYKINRSVFDNSWDIYPQDLPSYKYFFDNGITKLLVKGDKINDDLKKILYKYQKKGMKILFTDGCIDIKEIRLKKMKCREA